MYRQFVNFAPEGEDIIRKFIDGDAGWFFEDNVMSFDSDYGMSGAEINR